MNQLRHVRFMRHSRYWMVMTSLIVCALLTACQPIQPETDLSQPAATIPAPDLADHEVERWSETAPNGDWQANGLVALPKPGADQYYSELRVRRITGGVEWTPVARWSNFGLGYTTPRPLHWSPDGTYLYFTNLPVGDGCGLFINAADLQRVDLSTGTVTEILPPNITLSLTFAPDGSTVAYADKEGIVLLDPTTSDYTRLMPELLTSVDQWGNFVWSPDSQQLVFTVATEPCAADWQQSIALLDIQSQTTTVLIHQDERRFTAMAWSAPDKIRLQDADEQTWTLDIATGEIVE